MLSMAVISEGAIWAEVTSAVTVAGSIMAADIGVVEVGMVDMAGDRTTTTTTATTIIPAIGDTAAATATIKIKAPGDRGFFFAASNVWIAVRSCKGSLMSLNRT
jgi:hypothetical protein